MDAGDYRRKWRCCQVITANWEGSEFYCDVATNVTCRGVTIDGQTQNVTWPVLCLLDESQYTWGHGLAAALAAFTTGGGS